MNKAELREEILQKRKRNILSTGEFLKNLLKIDSFISAKNIGSYCSRSDEIPTESINSYILKNKNLYLPFSTIDKICFSKVEYESPLELNKKTHIFEPVKSPEKIKKIDLDFLIIPSVACDKKGNRLGRGLGWYDRFIKFQNNNPVVATIIADSDLYDFFDFVEEHDEKVDIIITEKGLYFCNDFSKINL